MDKFILINVEMAKGKEVAFIVASQHTMVQIFEAMMQVQDGMMEIQREILAPSEEHHTWNSVLDESFRLPNQWTNDPAITSIVGMPTIFHKLSQVICSKFDQLVSKCGHQFPGFNFNTFKGNLTRNLNPSSPTHTNTFIRTNLGGSSPHDPHTSSSSTAPTLPHTTNIVNHQDIPSSRIQTLHALKQPLVIATLIPEGTLARNKLLYHMEYNKVCSELEFLNSLYNVDKFLEFSKALTRKWGTVNNTELADIDIVRTRLTLDVDFANFTVSINKVIDRVSEVSTTYPHLFVLSIPRL